MTLREGRRADAIAVAVIVVAALCVFGRPLVRGEIFVFRDHTDYFAPLRFFTAMHLRAGKLPLWNPYNGSGEQWLANPQTGVFYPPTWLFVFLPFGAAFVLFLFAHALILGCGAYRLFRMRAGAAAASAASVGLMLSGPVLSLLDVQNNFTSFAWVPWVVWCALRERERKSTGRTAAVLLALVFLAGEPFYAATAAVLYCAIVRKPKAIAMAGAGAFAVAAVQLLPFIDLMIGSDRFGGYFAAQDILRSSMRGAEWLRMFVPPRIIGAAPREAQLFIFVVYAGVIVWVLALAGAVMLWREARSSAAGWLALLAASLLVAAGPSLLAQLPLTIFRYPSRVLPFAMLAIAALAAAGWERIRRGSPIVDAVLITVIVIDLLIAARPLLRTAPANRPLPAYPAEIGRNAKFAQIYGDVPLRAGSRVAWMAGYLNLRQLRFTASTPAPLSPRSYTRLITAAPANFDLMRQMGVSWLLVDRAMPPPLTQVARVQRVFAYRLPGALPMAYVRTSEGTIVAPRTLSLNASRADVSVSTSTGGLLVLSQNDARGWSVTVDGKRAEKKVAMGTFLAVEVGPGFHRISWAFRPLSLLVGAIVTLLSLLWVAAGARPMRAS